MFLSFDLALRFECKLMTSFGLSVGTGCIVIGSVGILYAGVGAMTTFGGFALLGIVGNAMLRLVA
ncbi:MAG: hypothetical protein ACRERU_14370 [Methylococcales bacterium]